MPKSLKSQALADPYFAEKETVPECGFLFWHHSRSDGFPDLDVHTDLCIVAHRRLDFTVERNDRGIHRTRLAVPVSCIWARQSATTSISKTAEPCSTNQVYRTTLHILAGRCLRLGNTIAANLGRLCLPHSAIDRIKMLLACAIRIQIHPYPADCFSGLCLIRNGKARNKAQLRHCFAPADNATPNIDPCSTDPLAWPQQIKGSLMFVEFAVALSCALIGSLLWFSQSNRKSEHMQARVASSMQRGLTT